MDALLNDMSIDKLAELVQRQVLDSALLSFYAFTLVFARMSGLMIIGPLFGQSFVPPNIRIFLVLTLSLLITPTLHDQSRRGFEHLDVNNDNRLSRAEIPDELLDTIESREISADDAELSISFPEYAGRAVLPASLFHYGWTLVKELALGGVLGLGVLTIISGLQLAGEMIDQQTGTSLGEVFSPGLDIAGSISGQLLFLLGVAAFLVMKPISGHLMMLSALIDTFQTLPIGQASVSTDVAQLLVDIIRQSFILAVKVAAPLLAVMSLVALSLGFLGHTVPQINLLVVGFPIRVMVSLFVLAATIPVVGSVVTGTAPELIERLRLVLSGLTS